MSIAGETPRPVVRFWLRRGSQRVQILALVDSGADTSILDVGYALLLGLNDAGAEVETAVTASGDLTNYLTWPRADLEIEFENRRFPYAGGFIDFPTESDPTNILGRADFFREHVVQFWERAQLLNVQQAPALVNPATTS